MHATLPKYQQSLRIGDATERWLSLQDGWAAEQARAMRGGCPLACHSTLAVR